MYCKKCGAENPDGSKFCQSCGEPLTETLPSEIPIRKAQASLGASLSENQGEESAKKPRRVSAILNIVAGAALLLIGLIDSDYDWGLIALCGSVGFLVPGILQILKKANKVVYILETIFGALTMVIGFACNLDFDWGYVGILMGAALLVLGILGLARRSIKVRAIVGIVFAGLLLFSWLANSDYDWGLTALVAAVPLLVSGVLDLVSQKRIQ